MALVRLRESCAQPVTTMACSGGLVTTSCGRCNFPVAVPVLIVPCSHTRASTRRIKRAPSPPRANPDDDLKILVDTVRALRLSGWYRPGLDWQGARRLLADTAPGAFFIRDSADSNFIFSLSVQTERGTTSVRLHFEAGQFRLDCEPRVTWMMPRFRGVVELVQHYVELASKGGADGTVWIDSNGSRHSSVCLRSGLRNEPPPLKHSARLAVHRALSISGSFKPQISSLPRYKNLPLPDSLITYLGEYPYSC